MKKILIILMVVLFLGGVLGIAFSSVRGQPQSIVTTISTTIMIPIAYADSLGDGTHPPPPPIPRDP